MRFPQPLSAAFPSMRPPRTTAVCSAVPILGTGVQPSYVDFDLPEKPGQICIDTPSGKHCVDLNDAGPVERGGASGCLKIGPFSLCGSART